MECYSWSQVRTLLGRIKYMAKQARDIHLMIITEVFDPGSIRSTRAS